MSSRDLATLQLKELVAEQAEFFPITTEIYLDLMVKGVIPEGAPYELIAGQIVRKDRSEGDDGITATGPRHVLVVKRLARLGPEFQKLGCHVQTQQPIRIEPDGMPEPDAAIIRGSEEDYSNELATPKDISCVIEVSDHSSGVDQGAKLLVYAAAQIACYVVLDIRHHLVDVYTNPFNDRAPAAGYAVKQTLHKGDILQVPTPDGPAVAINVSDLLP